jgi:hypothetical protein
MKPQTVQLSGVISDSQVMDKVLTVTVDVGQELDAQFHIPLLTKAGEAMLIRICFQLGMNKVSDPSQLHGKNLIIHVMQPQVAAGLFAPFVVVDVEGVR